MQAEGWEGELAHLLAYSMISLSCVNVVSRGLSFPSCRKGLESYTWLWASQWAPVRRSENARTCYISRLYPLVTHRSLSPAMWSWCLTWFGLWIVGSRPAIPQHFFTPYHWGWGLFFKGLFPPKESHCKCFHRNSVLCQRRCCGCAAEPTGRRCPSPCWKCNRSFHLSLQIFRRGLIHCGILEPGLLITTGLGNERF